MRTPLLAGLIAVLVPACMDGLTGVGDDDDDMMSGATCGNGAVESGEVCDDGNTAAGDGCSATCQAEGTSPRVMSSVDKPTATINLAKKDTITVTLQSVNGFAGDVTLSSSLVDGSDLALPGITVTGPASVTLAADQTATAAFEIDVPMNATGAVLNGTLKVDMTSSAGMAQATSAITVNNIYVVDYAAGTGTTINLHTNLAGTQNLVVKRGAILRFHNSDTITHIIHGDGTTFPHENQTTGGAPGRDYDVETIGIPPGSIGTLGCHTHPGQNNATYANYMVL